MNKNERELLRRILAETRRIEADVSEAPHGTTARVHQLASRRFGPLVADIIRGPNHRTLRRAVESLELAGLVVWEERRVRLTEAGFAVLAATPGPDAGDPR